MHPSFFYVDEVKDVLIVVVSVEFVSHDIVTQILEV